MNDPVGRFFRDPAFRFRCCWALALVIIALSLVDQPQIAIPAIVMILIFVEFSVRKLYPKRKLGFEPREEKGQETASFGSAQRVVASPVPKDNLGATISSPPNGEDFDFCALSTVLKIVEEVDDGA